jgi:hypothetical protein
MAPQAMGSRQIALGETGSHRGRRPAIEHPGEQEVPDVRRHHPDRPSLAVDRQRVVALLRPGEALEQSVTEAVGLGA